MDVYKQVEDSEGSYFKILNYHKFVMNNIRGYLPLKVRDVHFFSRFLVMEMLYFCHFLDYFLIMNYGIDMLTTFFSKLSPTLKNDEIICTQQKGCSFCHEFTHYAKDILLNPSWTI